MALNLNNIKKLFVVVEDETGEKQDNTKQQTSKSDGKDDKQSTTLSSKESDSKMSWKTSSSNKADGTVTSGTAGKYSQKIFDSLTKAIYEADLEGEDYLEFIQGLQAMKDLPMEETLKMKSVFMTLTTKGLTVAKIVESAAHYLKVLEKERTKFYGALDGQKKSKVESKKQRIANLEKQNKEKADLIKKLTDEIGANNAEIKKTTTEISDVEGKIKSTENDFVYTYDKITNQIKDNINKIKQVESTPPKK